MKSRRELLVIKRKTSKDRFWRGLKRIAQWCRWNRHLLVREQHKKLSRKIQGHVAYYGIRGNMRSIQTFRLCGGKRSRSSKCCRSPRLGLCTNVDPSANLMVEEPSASIAHARICGGPGRSIAQSTLPSSFSGLPHE